MITDKLTRTQLFFLTFAFVLGFSPRLVLLSWQEVLAGCAAGILFLFLLPGASGGSYGKGACLLFSVFFTLSLGSMLCGGAIRQSRLVLPRMPAMLIAAILLTAAVFAVSRGISAIGRFAEVSVLLLIPAGIYLLASFFRATDGFSLFGTENGSGIVTAFLPFSECAAFLFLLDRTVSRGGANASSPAKADAAAVRETFPFLSGNQGSPVLALAGGGAAAGLFLLLSSAACGNAAQGAAVPVLFLFSLTCELLRAAVLLYAAKEAVRGAFSCPEDISHLLPATAVLPFLLLGIYGKNIPFSDLFSRFSGIFYPVCGFLLPVLLLFVKKLQKVFDKKRKRQ